MLQGLEMQKYFEQVVYKKESILEILEKYSHSQHDECILDSKPAIKKGYKMDYCENVTKPVETINGEYRCFTYFLQLDLRKEDEEQQFDDIFMTSIFTSAHTFERRTNKA